MSTGIVWDEQGRTRHSPLGSRRGECSYTDSADPRRAEPTRPCLSSHSGHTRTGAANHFLYGKRGGTGLARPPHRNFLVTGAGLPLALGLLPVWGTLEWPAASGYRQSEVAIHARYGDARGRLRGWRARHGGRRGGGGGRASCHRLPRRGVGPQV